MQKRSQNLSCMCVFCRGKGFLCNFLEKSRTVKR
ncbi:hypothetical protein CL3_21440 [butyrate-producing bacterium SM4/1]|nr:hypothetical protein CL3_21440 [butyrate-producing bacterium SM4/1]